MNKFLSVKGDSKFLSLKPYFVVSSFVRFISFGCVQLFIVSSMAIAAEIKIPVVSDLGQDARIGRNSNAVILLYFSAPDCRYCMRLEDAVLKPMLRSGDYDKQVILRKVDWRSPLVVNGFSGQRVSLQNLTEHYAVKVTPTLVFVDPKGREVAPRILGFQSPDFFWFYLDRRIEQSRAVILREP